ncbi:cell division protein FtsQ/DivIB [Floricoccus penangensis]|uniref:Cell division protein DivIB n=1 Tax=Floricoccus penangensis TaxID=1859475 RepID=A0A9Q5NZA2_9LACT|nr:cell division protein FtsQ/DivIB [Floricoccus penangensis]OFI46321.1 hypothetical protein BG262_04720 [Floricoccus penangensis]URZ87048.1 cell division protein FtsQ/DivIB [Floricoccus penangensis]
MSDKKENNENKELSPWQQKHLEYQKEKNKQTEEVQSSEDVKDKKSKSPKNKVDDSEVSEEERIDFESIDEQEVQKPNKRKIFPILKKMWWVILGFLVVLLLNLYIVSPYSRVQKFVVNGDTHESIESIANATGIRENDRIYNIYHHRSKISKGVLKAFPRIENANLQIKLPSTVVVNVKEYPVVAYVKNNNDFYPVISTGTYIESEKIGEDKIDKKLPVLDKILDKNEVKSFIDSYSKLPVEIRSQISTVTKTPTKSTSDFLTMEMRDGNQVLVPLSEIDMKLPYYTSVKKSLDQPSTIDMEAGIFSSPRTKADSEKDDSQEKAEDKKKNSNQ